MASLTTGFKCRLTFAGLTLKEIDTTTMGLVLDAPIEQTSNANVKNRSFEGGDLITKTQGGSSCKYNIADVIALAAQIGVKQEFTFTYPDGSTEGDIGWLSSFVRDPLTIGTDPTAQITVDWEGETDAGVDNRVVTEAV